LVVVVCRASFNLTTFKVFENDTYRCFPLIYYYRFNLNRKQQLFVKRYLHSFRLQYDRLTQYSVLSLYFYSFETHFFMYGILIPFVSWSQIWNTMTLPYYDVKTHFELSGGWPGFFYADWFNYHYVTPRSQINGKRVINIYE